jgi:hypothetical protein
MAPACNRDSTQSASASTMRIAVISTVRSEPPIWSGPGGRCIFSYPAILPPCLPLDHDRWRYDTAT